MTKNKRKIEQKFMNIQMAYKTLIDPEKRSELHVTGYANLKDLERDERRKRRRKERKKADTIDLRKRRVHHLRPRCDRKRCGTRRTND